MNDNSGSFIKLKSSLFNPYFAAPDIRSLSCLPQTHQSGKSIECWQSFSRSSSSGCGKISSLILLKRSILAKHLLALSSEIGSTLIGRFSSSSVSRLPVTRLHIA